MSAPEPTPRRKSLNFRTILLILLVVALTLFCVFNSESIRVWPVGHAPLFIVILVAFVLGAGIGWLAKSLLGGRHDVRPEERV